MMLPNRQDQTPHLAIFLRHREELARKVDVPPAMVAAGAVITAAGFVAGQIMNFGLVLVLMGIGLVASWYFTRKPATPEGELAKEARTTAKKLSDSIRLKRIHRDLDEASLQLLEESARNWQRVQQALDGPAWTQGTLPTSLTSLRQQCLAAADKAMDEILVLYAPFLPETVTSKGFMDYAEDIAEGVFGARRPTKPLPSAFEPARQVAEKLKLLASEVERRSDNPAGRLEAAPGLTVDLALSELKQLDQAEEELRQNLQA